MPREIREDGGPTPAAAYYPLHPSVADKLDPVYKEFYNKHLLHAPVVHRQPLSVSRSSGILLPGGGPLHPVGSTQDFRIARAESTGPDVAVRVFTPAGEKPKDGWPCMIYLHGGGWVLGNIDTENTVSTNLCGRAGYVVISVDYRLAPEQPYPAAVEDSWETVLWTRGQGMSILSLDPAILAIGGSSAGGNLAAVMCHRCSSLQRSSPYYPIVPSIQLLIVPVTDNTASSSTQPSWREYEFTPALPAEKMMWFREHYLPEVERRAEAESSPLFYQSGWDKQPKALIVVGELDVLKSEGIAYAEKLKTAGVKVDLKIWQGMPHPFLAMDEILVQGRDTITLMIAALEEVVQGSKS